VKRSVLRTALVLLAGSAVVAMATPAFAGTHGEEHRHPLVHQQVRVTGTGSSVKLSTRQVFAGSIRFTVATTNPAGPGGGGSQISLFRLKPGKTLPDLFAALKEEFSNTPSVAAKGTRDIVATAIVRGLADVVPGHPETVTETLTAGTYYSMDLANPPTSAPPRLTRLSVVTGGRHIAQHSDLASQVSVSTVDEHFIAPKVWPHKGTYTFANRAHTIHFMQLQPVAPGTTDAQIQRIFTTPPPPGASGPPPGFLAGPTGGNDVVSPGYSLQLTYDLPRGTYVLLCFVADDRTGMPHALMGMHEVIVLK
jgi:hypothetical protein